MSVNRQEPKQHLYWVDFIRTVGAILVVFIHACFSILYLRGQIPDKHWLLGNAYNSLGHIAVPLFIMLTGFLLLRKEEELFVFIKKRFVTLFIPFLAWPIFYVLWYQNYPVGAKFSSVALSIIVSLLKSPPSDHLWYLYTLVVLYLFIPPLRLFVARAKKREILYIILVWVLTGPAITFAEKVFDFRLAFEFNFIRGYWGYLILGYWLGKKNISTKAALYSLSAGTLMLVVIFWLTDQYTLLSGSFDISFYSYSSLTVVLASAFFFIGFKKIGEVLLEKDGAIRRFFYLQGQTAFGVYMIHIVFLDILRKGDLGFRLSFRVGNPFYTIPLSAIAAYIVSFLSIILIKKIPIIKKLAP